jgi:hypothetical protein
MSHFTVLVVAQDRQGLHGKLLPYHEFGYGTAIPFEEERPYLEFIEDDECEPDPRAEGKRGYWRNPNAKWDEYKIGGRWAESLILKDDKERTAVALAGDIDWGKILDEQISSEMEVYHAFQKCLAKVPRIIPDTKLNSMLAETHKTYEDNEYCNAAFKNAKDCTMARMTVTLLARSGIYLRNTFQENADLLYKTEEEYCGAFNGQALTYAFIDADGKWCQRGEMGWWGMDDKSKGMPDYDATFWEFIRSLPDDQMVFIVDCHI